MGCPLLRTCIWPTVLSRNGNNVDEIEKFGNRIVLIKPLVLQVRKITRWFPVIIPNNACSEDLVESSEVFGRIATK